MAPRSPISTETNEYRRGVVLGLTMAEIMLLLIFCFLIAAAAIFQRQQQELSAAINDRKKVIAELDTSKAELKSLSASLGINAPPQAPSDYWRKLVEADEELGRLKEAGLNPTELISKAGQVQSALLLVDAGETIDTIRTALAKVSDLKAQGLDGVEPARLAALVNSGREALARAKGEHDWPPIISLSEANGYNFEVASAQVSGEFRRRLLDGVVDQVAEIVRQYQVDVIEVIGHTDEQPISARPSNLDAKLFPVLAGQLPVSSLTPGDNTGLGMARAVSVASLLKADARLKGVTVLPLSAGQLIKPADQLSDGSETGNAKTRRRIEIRARRSQGLSTASAAETLVEPDSQDDGAQAAAVTTSERSDSKGKPAPQIKGTASVIDGDTLEVHGTRIRIVGIDAPESGQTCLDAERMPYRCGQRAANALAELIGSRPVECDVSGIDFYGRSLARCMIGETDLGEAMVQAGWAIAFRRYSKQYVEVEQTASAGRVGMWSGEFVPPDKYRSRSAR